MKRLITYLNIHSPWHICRNRDSSYYEQKPDVFLFEKHFFDCGEFCNIEISNDGMVAFLFKTDIAENQAREYCSIFLYFVSICNGYNCEFKETAVIDGAIAPHFFSFAKEDEADLPLLKNKKFHEISLQEIERDFGNIVYKLFSSDRLLMLSLLSNYYSLIFYKDFNGNGIYKFRNIIANIESIISAIYSEEYKQDETRNNEYFKTLSKDTRVSIRELKKHLSPRRISLKDKLKDAFEYMQKFNLTFNLNINKECERIANTRNFISHLFDAEKAYLTEQEVSDYNEVFAEMFRMLFLHYYGVDSILISEKFLCNTPICIKLKKCFDIDRQ